jgi:hypothetical protein
MLVTMAGDARPSARNYGAGNQRDKSEMTRKERHRSEEATTIITKEPSQHKGRLNLIGGSASDGWNHTLANQTTNTLWLKHSDEKTKDRQLSATIAGLMGIAPKDELEAGTIDVDAPARDRDQLFAEPVRFYQDGATWFPAPDFEREHIAPNSLRDTKPMPGRKPLRLFWQMPTSGPPCAVTILAISAVLKVRLLSIDTSIHARGAGQLWVHENNLDKEELRARRQAQYGCAGYASAEEGYTRGS